ncbi:glycoside hydrolase family 19 protein [Pseudomonas yamanorum]|uniref:glycoside hydrolase family 19 protein n=1 Tax=Pseudomonas yamanorum TaxID=515393 RepID=UPI0015A02AF3|nr:glycoside hydrolase family 19 protein [Pseudomonas yamanorum]NVZ85864.1 glycoside hydrolase family 19 protein [Pseudomonas yamanorum]
MPVVQQQLLQIFRSAGLRAEVFICALNYAMAHYQITTSKRIAAFLAQVGHESGELRYVRELGSDHYLSKYDIGVLAARLGNSPEADGDGQKYRGRGLIQITGRRNYLACSQALFGDARLLQQPELLEQPQWAAESAAWFWQSNGLNELADEDQFTTITRRINGGLNGLENRMQLWGRAKAVFGVPDAGPADGLL